MNNTVAAVIVLFIFQSAETLFAQGCSDAGFCTIGHLNQLKGEDNEKNHQKFTLLLPAGVGDENVVVFTPGLQYDNQLNRNWAVQAKITANTANGNLGHVSGLGDIYLAGIFSFKTSSKWNTSLTLGTKLPLNQGNLKINDKPLPMQYQSSLGTVDLITGVAVANNNWQFAAGWQQPLTGINRNQFLPVYWNTPAAAKYAPSNDFNRKGDVLLRTAYLYKINSKLSLNGGLLGIYHLGEDTYIDGSVSNKAIPIKGSSGITVNVTLAAWYKVGKKFQAGITGGVPLLVRDVRPDGLTREFVIGPEISFSF